MPWKNPLYLGLADVWSLINFTFNVSIGVTAKMASLTPAPIKICVWLSQSKVVKTV